MIDTLVASAGPSPRESAAPRLSTRRSLDGRRIGSDHDHRRPRVDAVALVTGASSGIGKATARTLAEELRAGGATALAIEADIIKRDHAEAAVQRTRLGAWTRWSTTPAYAPRPDRRRADGGVGADGRAQRDRPALLRQRPRCPTCSPPPTARGRGTADLVDVSSVAAVSLELAGHDRPEGREGLEKRFADIERLAGAADIADAVAYFVTRPRRR